MANTTAATSNPVELSKASISACISSLSHEELKSDARYFWFAQLVIRFRDVEFSRVITETSEASRLVVLVPEVSCP